MTVSATVLPFATVSGQSVLLDPVALGKAPCGLTLKAGLFAEAKSVEWAELHGVARGQADARGRLEKLHYVVAAVVVGADVQLRQSGRCSLASLPIRFARGLCG